MTPRIPATVVTGFLGAGKTTLLRHWLARPQGKRLALVINEFGEVGVDRETLLGCGDETCAPDRVIELANGCLCCTVADDFLPAIETLLARDTPPDHIVVETSGLALPKPLVRAFAWPAIRSRVTVDGVVAMIDGRVAADGRFDENAPTPLHDNPLAEVFGDQLDCADLAVINKTDLLAPGELARLRGEIAARLRPGAKLVEAERSAVDPAVALGLGAAAEDDLETRPSRHDADDAHDHDDFESFSVPLPEAADRDALLARLRRVGARPDVLRVKGFAAVAGRPLRLALQGVGPRFDAYFDRPWRVDETRAGAAIVIGFKGLDRDAIAAAMVG